MSSGSGPTAFPHTSVVSTSHSFSRFGYCFWELSLRGVSGEPGVPLDPATTAAPPVVRVQPANTATTARAAISAHSTRRGRLISHSLSTGGGGPLPRAAGGGESVRAS